MKLTKKQLNQITNWMGGTLGIPLLAFSGDVTVQDIINYVQTVDLHAAAISFGLWVAFFAIGKDEE